MSITGARLNKPLRDLVETAAGPSMDLSDGLRALILLGADRAGLIKSDLQYDIGRLMGEDIHPLVRQALLQLFNNCSTSVRSPLNVRADVLDGAYRGEDEGAVAIPVQAPFDVGFDV